MVRVVTDSCSGISSYLAAQLGVVVVPLYVRFGDQLYRDNVDLRTEEFYHKLEKGKVLPHTSTVNPSVFAAVFSRLAEETDEILALTVSTSYSGTHVSAVEGARMLSDRCRIRVIDSRLVMGGQMLLVMSAARMARLGASLDEIAEWVTEAIPNVKMRMSFDTLEYLRKGGRIGKAQAFLGSLLKTRPVLAIEDGDTVPVARPRQRERATELLLDLVRDSQRIEAVVVEDANNPTESEALVRRLKSFVPPDRVYRSKVSPVIGTHVGPHVLGVSVLESVGKPKQPGGAVRQNPFRSNMVFQ